MSFSPVQIREIKLEMAPWQQLQKILDNCYPNPPRNVFQKVIGGSHARQRVWIALDGTQPVGIVMLSPHSKGGHLENLSVLPRAQGCGIGKNLVQTLLDESCRSSPAMISLTTRIPEFFQLFGFQSFGQLSDKSIAMINLLQASNSVLPSS